jgi:hypothetical protein
MTIRQLKELLDELVPLDYASVHGRDDAAVTDETSISFDCTLSIGQLRKIVATAPVSDAVLDDPRTFNTIDFRNELQPFLNEWLAKANAHSKSKGFAESYRYDSNDRWLLDHILIALLPRISAALEAAHQARGRE